MFDQEQWRRRIADRLGRFARNPRQELQLAGSPSLLAYLFVQTIDPFLAAYQEDPIQAIVTLAEITRGPGANQLVRRAARCTYQSGSQIDRELRGSRDIRNAVEQMLVELQTVSLARQRLNSGREEWLRATLERDLDAYPGEFAHLRLAISDPGGQTRIEALRRLRIREGVFSQSELVLIHESMDDASTHVRAQAARLLGMIGGPLPPFLAKKLLETALYDCDAETRYAAARAIGALREKIVAPQLLDELSAHLFAADRFHRAAAALVLGQLGELAGSTSLIRNLATLLDDEDVYAREAAARALGQIGPPAATPEVLQALLRATQDSDVQVHEAATDALAALREQHPAADVVLALSA